MVIRAIEKSKSINRLYSEKRIPYLFVGAGFTRRYFNDSLNWEGLLDELARIIGVDDQSYKILKLQLLNEQTTGKAYQMLGSFLSKKLQEKMIGERYKEIFDDNDMKIIINNKYDPFKYLISKLNSFSTDKLSKESFSSEKYKLTELRYFSQLKKNIPGIFTTNYDELIEQLFNNEFKVFTRQSDYFYSDNYNFAEIYKLHGSISDINSIIITEEDYANFINQAHLSIAKLLEILANHPVIFIGYSLNDEDIRYVLDKLVMCLSSQQMLELSKNLIFIEWKKHFRGFLESEITIEYDSSKALKITKIETDNYSLLFQKLSQLPNFITPSEVRRYKSMLANLINSNNKKLKNVFSDIYNFVETIEEDRNVIAGISASEKSSLSYTYEDIIRNYLISKTKYTSSQIKKWCSRSFNKKWWVPIYAYVDVETDEYFKHFSLEKHTQINNLFSKYIKITQISEIEEIAKFNDKKTVDKLKIIIKSVLNGLAYKDVKKYLKELLKGDSEIVNIQEFKIAVTIVSKLEFESKKNKTSKKSKLPSN